MLSSDVRLGPEIALFGVQRNYGRFTAFVAFERIRAFPLSAVLCSWLMDTMRFGLFITSSRIKKKYMNFIQSKP